MFLLVDVLTQREGKVPFVLCIRQGGKGYMAPINANQIWQAVLGQLQLQITRPSYDTWLRNTQGVGFDGNKTFTLGVPNAFVRAQLEDRMYELLADALESQIGRPITIKFATSENSQEEPSESSYQESFPIKSRSSKFTQSSSSLNNNFKSDSFVVGDSNELAFAASQAVADNPGFAYNPLVIYSGVGLGKTHLLHSIAHQMISSGLNPIYVTAEEFTNEYVKSIRENKTDSFREHYRSADALLLDDVQFLMGKDRTQEGFFHTFNALHMVNRQIVVASDRPISMLSLLEDRIRSRLKGGLVVDIQPPDFETRIAILMKKAEKAGHFLDSDIISFIAERISQNIRELEGGLSRLLAYSDLMKAEITLELVKNIISVSEIKPRIGETAILDAVSAYYGIDKHIILGDQRDRRTSLARHVAMYLMREDASLKATSIGKLVGGKNHATVLSACKRISSLLTKDNVVQRDVYKIRELAAAS